MVFLSRPGQRQICVSFLFLVTQPALAIWQSLQPHSQNENFKCTIEITWNCKGNRFYTNKIIRIWKTGGLVICFFINFEEWEYFPNVPYTCPHISYWQDWEFFQNLFYLCCPARDSTSCFPLQPGMAMWLCSHQYKIQWNRSRRNDTSRFGP